MQIKNTSPQGDLDVPLLRATVEFGELVDVTEDQARALLPQTDNWQPADDKAQAIADELGEEAVEELTDDLHDAGMPSRNGRLIDWQTWATSRGDVDAESKTRKELIAEHGPDAVAAERGMS